MDNAIEDWKRDITEANRLNEFGNIKEEVYNTRLKYDLGNIYKNGNWEEQEYAIRTAEAHGWDAEELASKIE